MTTEVPVIAQNRWPLARILILVLAGGFANLLVDIRVEHVDVVRERTVAWLPIIYSAFMMLACAGGFVFWNKLTRLILKVLFVLALLVGGLGFYFHTNGNLAKVMSTSVNAWTDPKMRHSHAPPELAPLAFAGLGLIGILATIKRLNS